MMERMYQVLRPASHRFVPIRQLRAHVLEWGTPQGQKPPLVLCHGWMDVAASWQFMVDAFGEAFLQDRWIVAMDWRGYGLTESPRTDSYWFPDYLADLDALLDALQITQPIDLVGHSMGGNVVMLYAAARPQRIRRLINLEGFGLGPTRPAQAPRRLTQWLDELQSLQRGEQDLRDYPDQAGVVQRLMKNNRRLTEDRAAWLALHWAKPDAQGRWRILGDAAHKVINPYLSREDETLAIYAAIEAPVLAVQGSDDSLGQWWKGRYTLEMYLERLRHVRQCEQVQLDDCGHMLHHDQPQALATLIERFVA